MALIPTQDVPITGLASLNFTTASTSDTAATGPGMALIVRNTDATTELITVVTPGLVDGLAIADAAVTIPATTGFSVFPLVARAFGALATITCASATGINYAVIRLAK
jgi:hypothetical protein